MTFHFQSNEEYLFVNHLLTMIYGKLPSYVMYQDNSDTWIFWKELAKDDDESYQKIYDYLCSVNKIKKKEKMSQNYIRKSVENFVKEYFTE